MNTEIKKFIETVNPTFQIICLFFTTIILLYGLYFAVHKYYSIDDIQVYQNFLIESHHTPVNVEFNIQNFSKAEFSKGFARVEAFLTFSYDNTKITAEKIDDFIIKDARILEKTKIISQKNEINQQEDLWHVLFEQAFDLNYRLFPIDDHTLEFIIYNSHPEVGFIVNKNSLIIEESREIHSWKTMFSQSVIHTILYPITNKISNCAVQCSIAVNQVGYRGILSIFLPLFIILFVALFTLSLPHIAGQNMIINLLLALNAFRIVLEKISPKTSYLLMSDVVFITVLITTFIVFVIHANPHYFSKITRYGIILLSHISIIAIFYIFLSKWL